MPGTFSGGVATTASSGTSERASTEATLRTPRITSAFGLTNESADPKPPDCRLRARTFPTDPRRALAPTNATERGRKNDLRLRMLNGRVAEREDV